MPCEPGGTLFALVGYVPDPLGAFLDEWRQAVPGYNGSQAHVTLLPPRPLAVPPEAAASRIRRVLQGFSAFDVELSSVLRFPVTNVVYVGVGAGSDRAHMLHDTLHAALNEETDAYAEQFEYRPHVTLALPVEGADIDELERQAAERWNSCRFPRKFALDCVVFLRQDPGGLWQRVWTQTLPHSFSHPRGA